jgi:hypothetical protein
MVRIKFGGLQEDQQYDYRMDRRLPLEDRLRLLTGREIGEIRYARSIVNAYLKIAKELEKKTEHILYDTLSSRERRHLWKQSWRRDQVFAVGPLVEHWSRYLRALGRQWEELGSDRWTTSSPGVGAKEKPLPVGDDEFREEFFQSREPLDRVKIPIPAA